MCLHRHPRTEERRDHLLAEERPVPFIVRVRNERNAGGNQLGAGRVDLDEAALRPRETDAVVGARELAVLELGLCNRGLEVDVPKRRRLGLIRETVL